MIWVEAERGLQSTQRFVDAPGVNEELAFECIYPRIEWVQLTGALGLLVCVRMPPLVREEVCIINVSVRVVRIELKRTLELSLCGSLIPVVPDGEHSELRVRRREALVNLYSPLRRLFCLR